MPVRVAAEIIHGGLEEDEPHRRAAAVLGDQQRAAGEAPVEELVETSDLAADDFQSRTPGRRPERREAPGRVDDEVAIVLDAIANGDGQLYFFGAAAGGGGLSLL